MIIYYFYTFCFIAFSVFGVYLYRYDSFLNTFVFLYFLYFLIGKIGLFIICFAKLCYEHIENPV